METFAAYLFSTDILKARGRLKGVQHWNMLTEADPYVTARFMYLLKGDKRAGSIFTGTTPEIQRNRRWQDVALHAPYQ